MTRRRTVSLVIVVRRVRPLAERPGRIETVRVRPETGPETRRLVLPDVVLDHGRHRRLPHLLDRLDLEVERVRRRRGNRVVRLHRPRQAQVLRRLVVGQMGYFRLEEVQLHVGVVLFAVERQLDLDRLLFFRFVQVLGHDGLAVAGYDGVVELLVELGAGLFVAGVARARRRFEVCVLEYYCVYGGCCAV